MRAYIRVRGKFPYHPAELLFLQGGEHLLRRTFKQAADAKIKQNVSGKKHFPVRKVIQDMPQCVSRRVYDGKLHVIQKQRGVFGSRNVRTGDFGKFFFGCHYSGSVFFLEFQVAFNMVKVVMGRQDK